MTTKINCNIHKRFATRKETRRTFALLKRMIRKQSAQNNRINQKCLKLLIMNKSYERRISNLRRTREMERRIALAYGRLKYVLNHVKKIAQFNRKIGKFDMNEYKRLKNLLSMDWRKLIRLFWGKKYRLKEGTQWR